MEKYTEELVAPCGANCAICSSYLAYSRGLEKKRGQAHCIGCRPRNKNCSFIKKKCETVRKGKVTYCHECGEFPCEQLSKLDEQYRKRFKYSFISNLEYIRDNGIEAFLVMEEEKHRCPICGDVICVHNKKCYSCQKVD